MISVSMGQELAISAGLPFCAYTRLKSVCLLAVSSSSSSLKEIHASKSLRLLAEFIYLELLTEGPIFLLALGEGALSTPREYF